MACSLESQLISLEVFLDELVEPTKGFLKRESQRRRREAKLIDFLHHYGFSGLEEEQHLRCRLLKPERLRPIHMAAKLGNTQVLRMLLQAKVDREAKTSKGRTALELAMTAAFHHFASVFMCFPVSWASVVGFPMPYDLFSCRSRCKSRC